MEDLKLLKWNEFLPAGGKSPGTRGSRNRYTYGIDPALYSEFFGEKRNSSSLDPEAINSLILARDTVEQLDRLRPTKKKGPDHGGFNTPFDHKLESEFTMLLREIHHHLEIRYRKELDKTSADLLSARIIDYLSGKKVRRRWITLGITKRPATEKEKIRLIRKLRRLYTYCSLNGTDEEIHMSKSLEKVFILMPKEFRVYIRAI
jgi:hypothetical protein